jgi:hypothetical protein
VIAKACYPLAFHVPIAGEPPMTACPPGRLRGPHPYLAFGLLGWLLLAGCAQPATTNRWVKSGVDDATAARELDDCQARANAVLARQQGINADITATLGGNWQRNSTLGIQSSSMNRSAVGAADQALANCMLAKGFTRQS